MERLQKVIAASGYTSRRKAEDLIVQGRVAVNGEIVCKLGTKVKKGDFIQIDPGTVHAIKGGIEILETQQNSDITYRVYDYNRLTDGKPRELHIEKSLDVITVPAKSVKDSVISVAQGEKNAMNLLMSCGYYRVWKLDIDKEMDFVQAYPFLIMSVVEGDGLINGQLIQKGDHFILPNGFGNVHIQGSLEIIASSVGV